MNWCVVLFSVRMFCGLTCTVVGYNTLFKKPNSLALCLISIGCEEGATLTLRY